MARGSVINAGLSTEYRVGVVVRPEEELIGRRFVERQARRQRLLRLAIGALVVAPTLAGAVYYMLLAAPRYESDTMFIVRGVTSSRSQGLQSLLSDIGISSSNDDTHAVVEFMRSRDALAALELKLPLRTFYDRPEADALARFPAFFTGNSFEWLYQYYLWHTNIIFDESTEIVTLKVDAFRAQDAKAIAIELVAQAEKLVNTMNERLEEDTVSSSEKAVEEASKVVLAAEDDLTNYRNAQIVVDPSKNSLAQLDTITQLSTELDQTLAAIAQTTQNAPSGPGITVLKAKADGLAGRIAFERSKLAGVNPGLADTVSGYEQLTLRIDLAEKTLAAEVAALEAARDVARRQRVYVEAIVAPNLPDQAMLPQRFRATMSIFAVSVGLLAMGWLVWAGVKEHGK